MEPMRRPHEAVPIEEIARLPYIDNLPSDGRRPVLQVPYWDAVDREWHLYFIAPDGHIGRLAGGESAYGAYFARSPADPSRDIELTISTLITQHLSFPRVLNKLHQFESDVHNCAAVLEKYHLISSAAQGATYTGILISTELEYLMALVRGMYDLLNEIVREIAPLLVTLTDEKHRVVPKQLPTSFAEIALHGSEPRSGNEIVEKRGLPPALANWYVGEARAFELLRRLRDAVIHRGVQLPTVLDLPDLGLAVASDEHPWKEFAIWEGVEPVNKRLVPLRLAFAAIVNHAIGASERLVGALASCVQLPQAVGRDIRVYLRSDVTRRLVQIPELLRQPWERSAFVVGGLETPCD